MKDFLPIVATVSYYDIENTIQVRHHPLYAASLSDAVQMMEEYYGQELETVSVAYADCVNTYFDIPDDLATRYIKEGAIL